MGSPAPRCGQSGHAVVAEILLKPRAKPNTMSTRHLRCTKPCSHYSPWAANLENPVASQCDNRRLSRIERPVRQLFDLERPASAGRAVSPAEFSHAGSQLPMMWTCHLVRMPCDHLDWRPARTVAVDADRGHSKA